MNLKSRTYKFFICGQFSEYTLFVFLVLNQTQVLAHDISAEEELVYDLR